MKVKTKTEYEKFEEVVRELISVPHDTIKAKLEEEKEAKKKAKKEKRNDH